MRYSIYLFLTAILCSVSLAHQNVRKNHRTSNGVINKGNNERWSHSAWNHKNNKKDFRGPAKHRPKTWRNKHNRHFRAQLNRQNMEEDPNNICGTGPNLKTRLNDPKHRIINGTDAAKNSWPSMVALFKDGRLWCGGSLLDQNHILTAAHCVENYRFTTNTSGLMVGLGMHTRKPEVDPQVLREISQVITHYMYDNRTYYNDIAILKMASPVKFNASISPVCIPVNGKNQYSNVNATVIGWGISDINFGTAPPVLQQLTQGTMTNADCREKFYQPAMITDKMFCMKNSEQDSCQGDSGGPVFYQPTDSSRWIQIGITSWGIGCADPAYPAVYTRVTSFVNWIKNNTNQKLHRTHSHKG